MPSGGYRKKAGRKPAKDKKLTVRMYIETSKINKLGGMDEAIECIYDYVNFKTQ